MVTRIFNLVCVFILIMLISPILTKAHTVTDHGSEAVGWKHGTHTNSMRPGFYFVWGIDQYWKDRLTAGNDYMKSETNNNLYLINQSAWDTGNFVEALTNSSATWVARVRYNYSGQHKTTWWIQFNKHYQNNYTDNQWNRIAQHEIGHVLGLLDLYESNNNHRLMYAYAGNYTGLTYNEKLGLSKIWGYTFSGPLHDVGSKNKPIYSEIKYKSSATFPNYSIEYLLDNATYIVEGKPIAITESYYETGMVPFTRFDFKITRDIKGNLEKDKVISVLQDGNEFESFDEHPLMELNKKYTLFLINNGQGSMIMPGGPNSKFNEHRGKYRNMRGENLEVNVLLKREYKK